MLANIWWRLVQFGFRLLYNEMAFTYDAVSWLVSLGQWRCWQRSALQFLPAPHDRHILELAHGTGNLQIDLHHAGYKSVAFDLSPYMGQIAKRKLARQNLSPCFVRGMAQSLPFADGAYSAIVSTFPTDFIMQDDTLAEAHRVLATDGKMIVVLNGVLIGGGVVKAFLEWLYQITGQRADDHREGDLTNLFHGHGFLAESQDIPCTGSIAKLVILTKLPSKVRDNHVQYFHKKD